MQAVAHKWPPPSTNDDGSSFLLTAFVSDVLRKWLNAEALIGEEEREEKLEHTDDKVIDSDKARPGGGSGSCNVHGNEQPWPNRQQHGKR